jgi:hypothetical protein
VSSLAGTAVLGFLVAAGLAGSPRHGLAARIAAAASATLLLPRVDAAGAWPGLALAAGAVALASPLPCLLAAAGATLTALSPESSTATTAPLFLALAATFAGGAVSSSVRSRVESDRGLSAATAGAGVALVAFLMGSQGGGLLRWTFALGEGAESLPLRGAGLLLGLALLAALGGTLLLGARLLTPAVSAAEPLAFQLLWPAATLVTLAAGHAVVQGARQRPEALAASASTIALLLLLAGALVITLLRRLLPPAAGSSEASALETRARRETAVATALVWVAAAVAGVEGMTTRGSYLSTTTLSVAACGLLGLAALAPTRFPTARRTLLLAALAAAVLLPQTL